MLSKDKIQSMYDAAVRGEFARNNADDDDDDEVQESSYALGCELEGVGGLSAAIRKLIDKARAADTELLSLREQLTELKALEPVAEVVSKFGDPEAFGEREINLLIDLRGVPYGTQLFTAAKPAED